MEYTKDVSLESFIVFSEQDYYDFNQPTSVPSVYLIGNNRLGKFFSEDSEDIINAQILQYLDQPNSFDFLSNPKEDIYTFDDGEDVC